MTFGVNPLDWTNIGRKLQTNMAETVGESLTLPTESSVLSPFAYYDGETDTVLTTYSAYLDTSMADAFTPAEVVTVKTDEDGGNIVVDVTPLKLLYLGVDGEGNQIVSEDSSVDGVDVDPDSGRSISILTNQNPLPAEYDNNLQQIYQDAIDTDTGWSPTYGLSSSDVSTQFSSVEELANSDSTSWVRLKQRNGTEEEYYFIPFDEYATLVDTIPATFTFTDGIEVYTAEPSENPVYLASPVGETSLNSVPLASTYESTLTDLNTAYEDLITPASNTTSSTSGSNDDDEEDEGLFEMLGLDSFSDWSKETFEGKENYVYGSVLAAGAYVIYRLWPKRKKDNESQTLGDMLDKALGSGKEIEG